MAPKKQSQGGAKPPVLKDDASSKDQKRLDQSNMLTQLKSAKATAEQKELLKMYQDLPRFDPKKSVFLSQWKSDKSCKWMHEYKQQTYTEKKKTLNAVRGYRTKFIVQE